MKDITNLPEKPRKIILIDDDSTFQKLLRQSALRMGIELATYPSLAELGSVGRLTEYDVAIIDYDLGDMTGPEIAEYTQALLSHLPVVLISGQNRQPEQKPWPASIKDFVQKSLGHKMILKKAQNLMSKSS